MGDMRLSPAEFQNQELLAEVKRLRLAARRFLADVRTPQPGEAWTRADVKALDKLRTAIEEDA